MGVTIVNKKFQNERWSEIQGSWMDANWWNWRAAIEALQPSGLVTAEVFTQISDGWCEIDKETSHRFAIYIRNNVLSVMPDGSRKLLDGTVTTQPDDGTFHRAAEDQHKNYGATRSFLEQFAKFLENSEGVFLC